MPYENWLLSLLGVSYGNILLGTFILGFWIIFVNYGIFARLFYILFLVEHVFHSSLVVVPFQRLKEVFQAVAF